MSASEEKVLLRRSTSSPKDKQSADSFAKDDTISSGKKQLSTTAGEGSSIKEKKMSSTYHNRDRDDDSDGEAHGGVSARFGPITDTILTTLSQDNLFLICLIFVELLGVILVILCTCWMLQLGGFGFAKEIIFNFHPVLMTLGMIFLNANGKWKP